MQRICATRRISGSISAQKWKISEERLENKKAKKPKLSFNWFHVQHSAILAPNVDNKCAVQVAVEWMQASRCLCWKRHFHWPTTRLMLCSHFIQQHHCKNTSTLSRLRPQRLLLCCTKFNNATPTLCPLCQAQIIYVTWQTISKTITHKHTHYPSHSVTITFYQCTGWLMPCCTLQQVYRMSQKGTITGL